MNLILSHIFFANGLLGLILFVEVLINFRRPLLLKGLILAIATSIVLVNVALLYSFYVTFSPSLIEISKVLLLASILNLLYVLYYFKLKKNILIFSILIILFKMISIFYFSFIMKIDNSLSLNQLFAKNLGFQITRIIIAISYFIFCLIIFLKIYHSFSENNIFYQKIKKWSKLIIFAFFLMVLSIVIQLAVSNSKTSPHLLIITASFCFSMLLLFRPSFLNKTNLEISLSERFNKENSGVNVTEKINLSKDLFSISFFHKAYYANKNASLEEFSNLLEISTEQLKSFILTNYKTTFTDLVNQSRVTLFVELVQNSTNNNLTIEGFADKTGFGSRQSFHRAFKKFHGGNPSDLLRAVS